MFHLEEGRTPVIVSSARTGTGKFGGALSGINCPELGAMCAKEAMKRAHITGDMVASAPTPPARWLWARAAPWRPPPGPSTRTAAPA